MKLPKIKKEDLTKQLREIVGDNDVEFDAVVDPMDVMVIDYDEEAFMRQKAELLKKLHESIEKENNYRDLTDT